VYLNDRNTSNGIGINFKYKQALNFYTEKLWTSGGFRCSESAPREPPISPSCRTYITRFKGNKDHKSLYNLQTCTFHYRVLSRIERDELP
jgi:hypothetical protein